MAPDPMSPYPPSAYGPPPSFGGPPANDDSLAWAGVGASLTSWLLCCCAPIPLIGLVANLAGFALSIAGVVCGGLAYRRAQQHGGRTDLALIGLLVGGARLFITFALFALFLVAIAIVGLAGVSEQLRNLGH